MDTYHWNVLVTYHWDVVGCFIWDSFETSWRRTDGTSLLRPLETFSQHSNKTSLKTNYWDVLATFHWDVIGCFIWDVPTTSLGCQERRRYDVATTSCCRVGRFLVKKKQSTLKSNHTLTKNIYYANSSSTLGIIKFLHINESFCDYF